MSSSNTNLTSKEQVFRDIHLALGQMSDTNRETIDRKFAQVRKSLTPVPVVDGVLLDRFIEKHSAVNGTFHIVSSFAEVPKAVERYLTKHELPTRFVTSQAEIIDKLDWPEEWLIENRSANKADLVSVTSALCVIAETGTIVVASSSQVSSTHMYLPDNHIVVFDVGQLVRHLDDALQVGSEYILDKARGFHMITGPSKTADVEQTIQYGAHGPRRLHTIILDAN